MIRLMESKKVIFVPRVFLEEESNVSKLPSHVSCQRQYHRYICYNKSVISTMQICDMIQDHSRFF